MTFFNDRALRGVRKFVQKTLTDTVEIRRMSWTHDLDENTLVSGYDSGVVIYAGAARIRSTTQQTEVVGESVMAMRDAGMTMPHDAPAIHRDDMVKVTESPNSTLVGRWFQVTEERIASQEGFKRVEMLSIAPSRTWLGSEVDQ